MVVLLVVVVVVVVALLLTAPRLLDGHHPTPLLRQLHPRLSVTVEQGKVGDDDRYGEGDDEHAGQGAEAAHNQPGIGLGHHVAVAHRRHRHHGPPEALRDALEVVLRVCVEPFGIVDEAGKDDHAKDEEEDEEGKLLGAGLEGVDEDLEAGRVAGQLEQPEDADDGEELQYVRVLNVGKVVLEQHVAVEAQSRHKVDPVERGLEEDLDGGGDNEADDELEGEPDVADELDEEEGLVWIGLGLVQGPVGDVAPVVPHRHVPVRWGYSTECVGPNLS